MGKGKNKIGGGEPQAKGWGQAWEEFLAKPSVEAALPAIIGLVALVLVWWTFDARLGISGDNCEFIILARSLAQGLGMSYINLPEPELSTKFPFGFPLVLAPLAWLFPQEWVPMKWLVAVFFVAAMPLYYLLVRHRLGSGAALWATGLCSTNLVVLDYADQVMSEIPYLTFSLLALLLLEQALAAERDGRGGTGWWLGVFFSLMAAYYTRTIAMALLVAVLGYLVAKGMGRRALFLGGSSFLAMLLWALRNRSGEGGGGYFYQLVYVNPYRPDFGLLTFKEALERMALNAQHYFYFRIPAGFYPEWSFAVSAFVISLTVAGAILCVKRRRHLVLLLYAVFFGMVLIIWPWTSERFLLPLIPVLIFLAVYLAVEIRRDLERRGWGRWGRPLVAGLGIILLAANLYTLRDLALKVARGYPHPWRNYYQAAKWIKENTAEDAMVICRKSYWMYVVSNRHSDVFAFTEPKALMADLEAKGADYVILEHLGYGQTAEYLLPALKQYSDRFDGVWYMPKPSTFVMQLLPPGMRSTNPPALVPPDG